MRVDNVQHLTSIRLDGTEPKYFTSSTPDPGYLYSGIAAVSGSADGKTLAYIEDQYTGTGEIRARVIVLDAETRDPSTVATLTWIHDSNHPNSAGNGTRGRWIALSPDGDQVAWVENVHTPFSSTDQIRVANVDGTGLRTVVTSNGYTLNTVAWDPHGERLIFDRAANGWDLWTINADGTNESQLTMTSDRNELFATYSPDGEQLAMQTSGTDLGWLVMTADTTGSPQATLGAGGVSNSPAWSPTGDYLAWMGIRPEGGLATYVAPADGSQDRLLLPALSDSSQYFVPFDWIPDDAPVDTTAPETSIDDAASGETNDNTPTFTFSAEPGAEFDCALTTGGDDPVYEPCTSPVTYPTLDDGTYTFGVRATDAAGNTGPAATRTFTVDTAPPVVTLDQTPAAASTDATPKFEFSSEPGAHFDCSLTRSDAEPDFTACQSPLEYETQSDGEYTFRVRAADTAGNTSQATAYTFRINTARPSSPSTPDLVASSDTGTSDTDDSTTDTTPTFAGTAPAGTTVTILVDGTARGSALTSDDGTYTVTASPLSTGRYQVTATATGETGTSEPSHALTITITAPPPPPTACATAANTLTGTDLSDTLTGGRSADRILGLGGNDALDGRTNNDCLIGGAGNDQLRGGVGNDELIGEDGTDTLTLGDGVDVAAGGSGNDRITSRDGVADRVDCGAGTADVVIADSLDITANCETVRRG